MRRAISGIIFAVLFMLPLAGFAAEHYDIHDRDGDDWLTWGPVMKIAFVEGFKAGSDSVIGRNDTLLNFPLTDRYDEKKAEKVEKEFLDLSKPPGPEKEVSFPASDVILLIAREGAERKKAMNGLGLGAYSTERLVDGIDDFYGQYENRDIKIQDAVYFVKKKIDGAPGGDLGRILNYLRSGKEQTNWLVVYDEKGQMKKFITFP